LKGRANHQQNEGGKTKKKNEKEAKNGSSVMTTEELNPTALHKL
jgi:hypothetical protein